MKIQNSIDRDSLISSTGQVIYRAIVVDVNDESDAMRIKARIASIDSNLTDDELPWCMPFLPKFLNILPIKDEFVKIIVYDTKNPKTNREWLGPVISQPQNFNFDPFFFTALAGSDDSPIELSTAPSTLPEVRDGFPKTNEIAFVGRKNTDLILRDNELLLRAGKFRLEEFVEPYLKPLKFNRKNPAYLSMKINDSGTTTNIVADRINLISHEGKPKLPAIISLEEDVAKLETLHPLPHGDTLLDFLNLVKNFCITHIHTGPKLPANIGAGTLDKIRDFDLSTILANKKIRIN